MLALSSLELPIVVNLFITLLLSIKGILHPHQLGVNRCILVILVILESWLQIGRIGGHRCNIFFVYLRTSLFEACSPSVDSFVQLVDYMLQMI